MAENSKILILGGTGYIGKFIVEASANSDHPTFALVRESAVSDPVKGKIVQGFKDSGVTIVIGDLNDHESLVKTIKQVDVVISTVGQFQLDAQDKIIAAIKEAGNVKRFLPLEFGNDVDRTGAVGPAKSTSEIKAGIRSAIEEVPRTYVSSNYLSSESGNDVDRTGAVGPAKSTSEIKAGIRSAIEEVPRTYVSSNYISSESGNDVDRTRAVGPVKSTSEIKAGIRSAVEEVPRTYVSSSYFAGHSLPTLLQAGVTAPPRDKVVILGDGNAKAVFNKEQDIGTYTIKAVDDPRTLNKILYIRPHKNIYSFNELVELWEKKIGKTLEKEFVPEEQVLKQIEESPIPNNIILGINHSIFVKGDQTDFEIDPSFGVEASELYPDVKYTTVEEYLHQFV